MAKRLRVEVVDAFHGLVYGLQASDGSDGRLGFYRGDEDEDISLEVEDCKVTAVPVETCEKSGGGEEFKEILEMVPEEYDVGALGEAHRIYSVTKHSCVGEDFEYPASMTQGSSLEEADKQVSVRCLPEQNPKTSAVNKMIPLDTQPQIDVSRPIVPDDWPKTAGKPMGQTMASVFTTGSGSAISISKEKLAAAAKLLNDDHNDDISAQAAPKPSTRSIFTTGAGSAISISKEKMDAAARFLAEDAKTPVQGGREHDSKTPNVMSRFMPRESVITKGHQINRTSSMQTPGNALLAKKRHLSSSGIQTPRLITPQHTTVQKLITPKESSAFSSEKAQRRMGPRYNLPITPQQASTYYFGESYGPGDIRAHLLLKKADPNIVGDAWVRNHYKWIVWKLALVDLYNMAHVCEDVVSALHYNAVKDAIYTRYQTEYVGGKSSFLKGVLQRDIPSVLPCVLKVASTEKIQSTCRIELTDGWYSIFCDCDEALSHLVGLGKIYIGKKLRISNAELVGGSPGEPLEAVKSSRFILGYNQVHPASPYAKLGFQRIGIPITPLSCIQERGGKTPRTVVTVLRRFPMLMWSKLLSGVSTFQTKSLASKAVAVLDAELEDISIKAKDRLQLEELEMCKEWLRKGSEGGVTRIEILYATFVVAQSQGENSLEGLDENEKDSLQQYITDRMAELDQIQQRKCKEMLGQELPAALGAKSIPCQTLLVGEVSRNSATPGVIPMEYFDVDKYPKAALVMVWNPSDQISSVKEGDLLSITATDSFTSQRYHGEFLGSLKHLQTTTSSEITVLAKGCMAQDRVVIQTLRSREERALTIQNLLQSYEQHIRTPRLITVAGFVLRAGPVYLAPDLSHHYQWVFLIDATQQDHVRDSTNSPIWMMAIHLCGPQDAIKWFDTQSTDVVCQFENVSVTRFDNQNHIIALEGSMATSIEKQGSSPLEALSQSTQFLQNLRSRLDTVMSS